MTQKLQNKKVKKVAIILHGLGANGIDSLFANLSEVWSDNFEIYYFLAVDKNTLQFWDNRLSKTNVKVVKLHDLNNERLKYWPRTLYKALKEYGPFDVLHSNMDMLNGISMLVAKLCKIPIRICHAHRGNSVADNSILKSILVFCYRSIMKFIANNCATGLIACSDVAGEYFFGQRKYNLLYNGINLDKYRCQNPTNLADSVVKNEEIGPRFITVGRMTGQKNPIKIITVFDAILKLLPNAQLTYCGDGEMRNVIEAKIKELGLETHVKLTGVTNNVADYLIKSDYFLLPSFFEGLSLALAEAQAAGLDCFISDTCSKLSDCGKCIFIPLEAEDAKWAELIYDHVNKPKLPIDSDKLELFNIRDMAKKLESIYANEAL